MLANGTLGQSGSGLNQGLDAADAAAQLVHAGTEHGTLDLYHVLVAHQRGVDADGVLVHDLERAHVELADAEHRVAVAGLAVDADGLRVGVARESAGIAQQRGCRFRLLHLVEHRALHLTRDVDQRLVGTDRDDVVVLQAHIARQLAVQQEVIHVDVRQQTAIAVYLDITQRSNLVGTASHIQGIVDAGKGRHGIGARHLHLADDADGDGARLT